MRLDEIGNIREDYNLITTNKVVVPGGTVTDAKVNGKKVSSLKAVYPLINASYSDLLTKNFTLYPKETLLGNIKNKVNATGYHSYIHPTPKPLIKEHRLSDSWERAETPMGRIIMADYIEDDQGNSVYDEYGIGLLYGSGYLQCVGKVVDPESIPLVVGGALNTVSVGGRAEKVIDSITGLDLIQLQRNGDYDKMPEHERGQIVDGKLCYHTIYDLTYRELSFVNNPAVTIASTVDPDIGEAKVTLLLAQKPQGIKESAFYDLTTLEKVEIMKHSNFKGIDILDSFPVAGNFTVTPKKAKPISDVVEKAIPPTKPFKADSATTAAVLQELSDAVRPQTDIDTPGESIITDTVTELLAAQLGREFSASQDYLAVGAYFDKRGLSGWAKWFYNHAEEERQHGLKILEFLVDTRMPFEFPAVPLSSTDFESATEAVEMILLREQEVTRYFHNMAAVAMAANDFTSFQFVQWFIKEQVEEEAIVGRLVDIVRSGINLFQAEDLLD